MLLLRPSAIWEKCAIVSLVTERDCVNKSRESFYLWVPVAARYL